jgi:hypothetical protein
VIRLYFFGLGVLAGAGALLAAAYAVLYRKLWYG